jgi:hypothetical protein
MICMFYSSNQTDCIAYFSAETVGALIVMFCIFWGFYSVIKITLRLLGF